MERRIMKINKYFRTEEFLPKYFHDENIKRRKLPIEWFYDMRIVEFLTWLREHFDKKITVNDYAFRGKRTQSGLRVHGQSHYKNTSQHAFGRACDFLVEDVDNMEVAEFILDNQSFIMENFGITTLEDPEVTPGWTHIDTRFTNLNHIMLVR